MRKHYWGLSLFAIVFILVSACATPSPGPAPATTSVVTPVAPAPQAQPATTTASSQDTEWQKIVAQGKKEGMVVVQNTIFSGDIGVALSNAFKEKYGIRLEFVVSRGGESYERLKTEKRSGQRAASLVQASGLYMLAMKNDGLLTPVNDLPALREKDVWSVHPLYTDPAGYILLFYKTLMGPYINTKIVKPGQEPQSIFDLLKPEWKGKLVVSDPRTGSGTYWYYTTLVNRKAIDWNYVKSLGQQDLTYERNASAAMDQLMRGQASINLIGFGSTSGVLVDAGAPIKAISLKEGDVFDLAGISMVDGAPNPNATRVFMNWLLSKEGMTIWANIAKQETLRKDVPNLLPKDVIPPSTTVPKIGITMEDLAQAGSFSCGGLQFKVVYA